MSDKIKLEKYNISVDRGFLPTTDPLLSLPEAFRPWEQIGICLVNLIENKELRVGVDRLPHFPIDELKREEEWWRAYSLLIFISHAYVWCEGDEGVASALPEVLAIPLYTVARHLDLPPVITHATAVLYNWHRCNPSEGLNEKNVTCLFSFTGTADEEWFYIATVLVELAAASGIWEIPSILSNCSNCNNIELVENLLNVQQSIKAMQEAVYHMRDRCNPMVFYGKVRSFHAGWKNNDTLPNGLLYKGVANKPLEYSGGNAGQSSTLASFDLLLGVVHSGHVRDFFITQRCHMIRQHRLFLEELEARAHLRDYVKQSDDSNLVLAFNNTIEALVDLRNEHIKLVTLYIVLQKGKVAGQTSLQAKGTGGTGFMQFLKTARDNTKLAKL